MTTKAPEKTKKDGRTPNPADLPLRGNLAAGEIERLDGKGMLKSPPDPLVFERAKIHVKNMDEQEDARRRSQTSASELIDALNKSHKQRYVRIPGKHATYVFTMKTLTKLVAEKQDKVK